MVALGRAFYWQKLLRPRLAVGDNSDRRWVGMPELDQFGLPAPVSRLLSSIEEVH